MAISTSCRPLRQQALPLIVLVGTLVGGNFALAKFIVLGGLSPLLLFAWQVLGAGLLLSGTLAIRRVSGLAALRTRPVFCYCMINGLLGVSAPQVLSYFALQQVPASLFTLLITLSPLLTFCLSSLANRRLLPRHRLLGILIGLAGVTIATTSGGALEGSGLPWIGAAVITPFFLAASNVYRERAMPPGTDPSVLAAGTLLTQAVLFLPAMVFAADARFDAITGSDTVLAILCLCAVTALSYVLTFELYRRTDGVGFSQVGYFVTLSGIAIGALVFDEPIGPWFSFSVLLLFLGMAISNGHLTGLPGRRAGENPKGNIQPSLAKGDTDANHNPHR
ncbi:DMT family transporter [Roseibium sp. M-1]